jgi:hypothetical protein
MAGISAHLCLNTPQLVYHEYNITIDGVDRLTLTLAGGVGEEYIYAENTGDLSQGIVLYINVLTNTFRVVEDGVRNDHLTGDLTTSQCQTSSLVYIDATEAEVEVTAGPVSIFDTIDSSRHSIQVNLTLAPVDNPTATDFFEANGEFCERQYGIYRTEDLLYDNKYIIKVSPYGDYPFKMFIKDDDLRLMVSGNLVDTGSNYLSANLDFTYNGYEYSGQLVSSASSCST